MHVRGLELPSFSASLRRQACVLKSTARVAADETHFVQGARGDKLIRAGTTLNEWGKESQGPISWCVTPCFHKSSDWGVSISIATVVESFYPRL